MSKKPFMRAFVIDGQERTDVTLRLPIIRHYAPIAGQTVIDLGSGDGCEPRAMALAGAKRAVGVEAKGRMYEAAKAAQDYLKLPNHELLSYDVRKIDTYGLGTFDVVTCFGLLYHMTNPFNVLKRIRRVTGGLLLLETHIAPRTLKGVLNKLLGMLPFENQWMELDGVPFEGKIVHQQADPSKTKGSLDSAWTFWLTLESLTKALVKAGFVIADFQYELDPTCPEPLRKWGSLLGVGHANAKVWIAAVPAPLKDGPVQDPTERLIRGRMNWRDTPLQFLKRKAYQYEKSDAKKLEACAAK